MTDSGNTAPSRETTEDERRDAIMRRLVAESSKRFARDLIAQGVDRAAIAHGFRDAVETLRDEALAEAEPGGNA